jgi:hypothetical protein
MGSAQRKTEYTPEEIEIAIQLHDDFEFYAAHALKIKPKSKQEGALIPLKINTAQRYLRYRIEKQKQLIGMVRAYVLKGRQQGCSTYIEGEFFHDTSMNYGIKTFIQTHSKAATKNLFGMSQRFLKNLPLDLKPHVGTSNTTELIFDELDSGYAVSTAGSKETGRSDTIDNLHGSEVAFWNQTNDHTSGLIQAVPYAKGTKIVLESTANGMGGFFHKGYVSAEAGTNGDYIAIFIPWHWQEEYRKPVPEGFTLTDEELEYMELYGSYPEFKDNWEVEIVRKTLDVEQIVWRRDKIAEFEGNVAKFNQEYPATAQMAFQYSAVDSFIPATAVIAALQRPQYRSYGAIVAGFDPSHTEHGDKKGFIYRQGANAFGLDYPKLKNHNAMVTYCKKKLDNKVIVLDKLFVLAGGGGYAVYDDLVDDGYDDRVELVNEGKDADEAHKYSNKRAEMSAHVKEALIDDDMPLSFDIDPKYHDTFTTELTAEGSTEDHACRTVIEKKEKAKIRTGYDPAGYDSLKATFSRKIIRKHVTGGNHGNASLQRLGDNDSLL